MQQPPTAVDPPHRKWWILGAMGGVIALVVLDETALGVALPTIRHDLGISMLESHWIVNAYLLTLTGLAAVAGKSLDLVGMKRLFLCGLALFGAASLTCGFATSGAMLIAARAVQGIGSAIIFPTCVVMITAVFPPAQRGTAFGIQVTVAALFLASGPLIGGLITQHLDWRWVFWVNLPLVLAVFAVVLACWRDPPRAERPPRLDVWGATAFIVGLCGVVVALMQAVDWGWTSPAILGTLGGSVLILAGFVRHELRTTAPLIQMRLFANRVFTVSDAIVFAAQFSKISVTVLGAMYLQQTVGLSPTEAGTVLLAAISPTIVTSLLSGRMTDRLGARTPILLGGACSTLGLLWITLAIPEGRVEPLLPGLILWGTALPFLNVPPRRAVMNAVAPEQQGQAGGLNLTSQLLGGTVGLAIGSALVGATRDFRLVFLVPTVLTGAAWIWSAFVLPRRSVEQDA